MLHFERSAGVDLCVHVFREEHYGDVDRSSVVRAGRRYLLAVQDVE
jgi:hypothetical protein